MLEFCVRCLPRLLRAVKEEHSFTLTLVETKGDAHHKTIPLFYSFTLSASLWWLEGQRPESRPFWGQFRVIVVAEYLIEHRNLLE